MTIFWAVPHPVPTVWLVVESNSFCYVSLVNSTVSEKCILHLWGQSEVFSTSTIFSLVFDIPCTMGSTLFIGLSLRLIFFSLFIMLVWYMVHLHSIKFPFRIVIGEPPPILVVSSNLFLWFIDASGFKVGYSLNRTLVGVPSLSVGASLCVGSYSSLYCFKEIFFSNLYRQFLSIRI